MVDQRESRVWGDQGTEPAPGEETYSGGERPIAEYDNWAMWAITKDIDTIASILGSLDAIKSVTEVRYETLSERPAAGTTGRVSILVDEQRVTVDDGNQWLNVAVQSHDDLAEISSDDHHPRPAAGEHLEETQSVFDVQPESIDASQLDGSSGASGQILSTDGNTAAWSDPPDSRSAEEIEDIVAALVAAGDKLSWTYDDANDTLTVDTSALDQEEVEDAVASLVATGSNLTVNYDDANNALTIGLADDISVNTIDAATVSADRLLTESRPADAVVYRNSNGDLVADATTSTFGDDGTPDEDVWESLINSDAIAGSKPGGSGLSARRSAEATIYIASGVQISVSGTLDHTDLSDLRIAVGGRKFTGGFSIETSRSVGIDHTNSRAITYDGVTFNVPGSGTHTPDAPLYFARDDSGEAVSNMVFNECLFRDNDGDNNTQIAYIYNYASEEMRFNDCDAELNGAVPKHVATENNVDAISSPIKTEASGNESCLGVVYQGCSLMNGGAAAPMFEFEEGGGHEFNACFVGLGSDTEAFRVRDSGSFTRVEGFQVNGGRYECRLLDTEAPSGGNHILEGFHFSPSRVHTVGVTNPSPVINTQKTGSSGEKIVTENLTVASGIDWVDAANVSYTIDLSLSRYPDLYLTQGDNGIPLNANDDIVGGVLVTKDESNLPPASNFVAPLANVMVDGTYWMPPRGTAPSNPRNGMIAVQNGGSWDPAGSGEEDLVVYLNGGWTNAT